MPVDALAPKGSMSVVDTVTTTIFDLLPEIVFTIKDFEFVFATFQNVHVIPCGLVVLWVLIHTQISLFLAASKPTNSDLRLTFTGKWTRINYNITPFCRMKLRRQ